MRDGEPPHRHANPTLARPCARSIPLLYPGLGSRARSAASYRTGRVTPSAALLRRMRRLAAGVSR